MSRWLVGSGPLGVRHSGGRPTRSVADFVAATAAELVAQGDEVMLLLCGRPPNEYEKEWLTDHGLAWYFWGNGRPTSVRHAIVLHRTLSNWKPDAVIFEFGAVSLGIPIACAHRVRIRIARYLTAIEAVRRDGQPVYRSRVLRRRCVYKCATNIAVNARPLIDEVSSMYGFPKEQILLQLQGVYRPQIPYTPFADRVRELVCVGRIARTKGQHVLIDALAELGHRALHPRVHFVGDGDIASLERHAAALGILDQCVFHGPKSRADVYEILGRCAIAVQPSLADALPQSAQEAVVCGAVVVASRVGGIPDVVEDNESGLLVPPGRPDALADALQRVIGDEEFLRRLARGAERKSIGVAMDARAPAEAGRLRRLLSEGARGSNSSVRDIPL